MSGTPKPCPFCGSANVTVHSTDWDGGYEVVCLVCDGLGPGCRGFDAAIELWNRRALPLLGNDVIAELQDGDLDFAVILHAWLIDLSKTHRLAFGSHDLSMLLAATAFVGHLISAQDKTPNPDFLAVVRGLVGLHRLIAAGKDDSPGAEAIRDALDAPLRSLSEAERAQAQALSEDLYLIHDPEAKS